MRESLKTANRRECRGEYQGIKKIPTHHSILDRSETSWKTPWHWASNCGFGLGLQRQGKLGGVDDTDKLTCSTESQTLIIDVDSNEAIYLLDVYLPMSVEYEGPGELTRVNSEAGIRQHTCYSMRLGYFLLRMHIDHNMIVYAKSVVHHTSGCLQFNSGSYF